MKPLRLLLLVTSLLAAVLAAFLLAQMTFAGVLPRWLLETAPALAILLRWLPSDILTVGLASALIAMVCFGLALPAGSAEPARLPAPAPETKTSAPFALIMGLSAAAALLLAVGESWLGLHGWLAALVWGVWLALLLSLAGLLEPYQPASMRASAETAPERSWPRLIPVLLLAAFLFVWRSATLPAAYPAQSFQIGIQAQSQLAALAAGPFAPGSAGLPAMSTLLTAAAQVITPDPIQGLAVAGSIVGVLLVAATWLLATELFRRTPVVEQGELLRDAGALPALLAALALASMLPMMHAARLPWVLEPVLLGVLGLWLLLHSLRTGRTRRLVLSGTLLGLAALWSPQGWLWAALALFAVGGFALRGRLSPTPSSVGIGLRGLLVGAAALAVTAAPSICLWGCGSTAPAFAASRSASGAGGGLEGVLAVFGLSLDALATPAHSITVGLWITPLLLLALGGLVARIDRPVSWLLLPWLALGTLAAARHAQALPEWSVEWSSLVLLLPAVALAVAFALDAIGAVLSASVGPWTARSAQTLAVGLLIVAALFSWKSYARAAGIATDQATTTARALAAIDGDTPVTLLDDGTGPTWEDPALRFALAGSHRITGSLHPTEIGAWSFQPQESILVPPRLSASVPQILERAPGAQVYTRRDSLAVPSLYIVQLP